MKIDTILYNGRIRTIDPLRPNASKIGILQGRIVGLDEELDGLESSHSIDLRGAPVVPGFNDSHMHFSMMGVEMARLDLSLETTPTLQHLYEKVEAYAQSQPDGAWIQGQGYDQNRIGGHPERDVLDQIAGGRPVYLVHNSHHMAVVNTKALEMAGHPDPESMESPTGGTLGRYPDGRMNGLLQEQAMNLVSHVLKPVAQEVIRKGLATASNWALSHGITSATEPGICGDVMGHGPADLRAFQDVLAAGSLKVRMTLMPYVTALHSLGDIGGSEGWGLDLGILSGFGDERLRIGPVKILSDGSLIGRTAAVCCGYHDAPNNEGYLQWERDELERMLFAAHRNGWQIATHAIGDYALDTVLDIYDEAQHRWPRHDSRHRIEHAAISSLNQVKRIVDGGYIPVPQGRFISTLGDGFVTALGKERLKMAYRMRSFVEAGVTLPGSTDAPVVSGEAILSIHDMVNRKSQGGQAIALEEALTPLQAVEAYTHGSAYAVHEETRKGTLTPGKLADLVVLSDDPVEVDPERIAKIEVGSTMVNGIFEYDAAGLLP
ncbi:amidohydrolase [Nesterenkonia sp. LB17]|uniref:amidohydrolase n=1 Tax=Nesterenkonia sp. LB17 TaxID=2901230 RepID=UPI001F4C71A1|nr:amidohydrolase [Nesterenkonia sp. LB17]MCH8565271.1 amidohydrolase [Nesterenkonia sp. LB17]